MQQKDCKKDNYICVQVSGGGAPESMGGSPGSTSDEASAMDCDSPASAPRTVVTAGMQLQRKANSSASSTACCWVIHDHAVNMICPTLQWYFDNYGHMLPVGHDGDACANAHTASVQSCKPLQDGH